MNRLLFEGTPEIIVNNPWVVEADLDAYRP
ncbi:hypothetical protein [Lancefieldella rimae]